MNPSPSVDRQLHHGSVSERNFCDALDCHPQRRTSWILNQDYCAHCGFESAAQFLWVPIVALSINWIVRCCNGLDKAKQERQYI